MNSVHGTHASLGCKTIDASKKARNCSCCVRLRLEGELVMCSVHPNCAWALSASECIETISSGILCVHLRSESITDPEEEAEWTSCGVECLVWDCDCCVGMVLTSGMSIATTSRRHRRKNVFWASISGPRVHTWVHTLRPFEVRKSTMGLQTDTVLRMLQEGLHNRQRVKVPSLLALSCLPLICFCYPVLPLQFRSPPPPSFPSLSSPHPD